MEAGVVSDMVAASCASVVVLERDVAKVFFMLGDWRKTPKTPVE